MTIFSFFFLLVSSASNFCPDTRERWWSLFQTHLFSCAVGRDQHYKQISLACVGSAHRVSAALGLPPLTMCMLSFYTSQALCCSAGNYLSQALGCIHFPGLSCSGSGSQVLHKSADLVGPAFGALPRSEQLRWPGAWWAQSLPGRGCILSPSASQPLSFLSGQWMLLLRCAGCLLWGADLWLWPSW